MTYQVPALPLRRRARLHEQAAVRPQARPRHAAAALRASRSSSTRSPCDLGLDPADMRLAHLQPAELAHRELPARRLDGPRRVHRQGRRGVAAGGSAAASCRAGAGLGLACSSYICGAGLPDLLEPHAAVGRAAEARPRRRRDGLLRLDRDRPGLATRSSPRSWRRCSGIDLVDIRVVTGDTDLTPVDLGSYSSRVTLMMGNAAHPGGRARAGAARRRPSRRSSRSRRARLALRRGPRLRRRGPRRAA